MKSAAVVSRPSALGSLSRYDGRLVANHGVILLFDSGVFDMHSRLVCGTSLAIGFLWLSAVSCRGDEPAQAAVELDVVYTKAGADELKLDIARPTGKEGVFPAVLVIHGGGWRGGNKSDVRQVMGDLTKRGYVAVSPQYRFCPKSVFPAQVHDVKAAVRFIKANAKKYQVDPDRIGAMGFSAGGHLALMLGVTGPEDGLEGEVSAGAPDSRVKAVVNYFGPTDLAAKDIPDISKPLVKAFLGGTAEEKPEVAAKASPLTFVSKDDAPVLTFQGTKDPLVPYSQAIKLAGAMDAAGVSGRVELLIGGSHGWGGAEMDRTESETFQFLDRHLKPASSSKP
jgi:acetyl esterase/lipase